MNYSKILGIGILLISFSSFAQVGGNQVYRQHHSYGNVNAKPTIQRQVIRSTDSTLIINSFILLNKRADKFEVSVGVHQEGETVAECNKKMNQRIEALKTDLKTIGVEEKDLYVDYVAQSKIYDYEVGKTQANQVQKGFELKKNVIFIIEDIGLMDKISVLCAKQEIYDIVKVEYINEDIDAAYTQLFDESVKFINKRKEMFLKVCEQKLSGKSRISFDNFYSLYPKNQYVSYQPFETADLQVYNHSYNQDYVKKELRKTKTFYYDGTDVSPFDKVLNAADPEVGIQYVLQVEMVYEFKE
ncbi:MAG: SIMPL domain-containing protein [Crocinitomicaceae bacterium]